MITEFILILKLKICNLIDTNNCILKRKFDQFQIQWVKSDFGTYFPILYSYDDDESEMIIKNKNKKFITISQQSSDFLKKFYKSLENFYSEYSHILTYYLILYNLLLDNNLLHKLYNEYSLLQYDSKREKWWNEKIDYFFKLKFHQIQNKGLSATELWFVVDKEFLTLLNNLYNGYFNKEIEETKVEKIKEETKVEKEETNVIPYIDEKLDETEKLIAKMVEEMSFEDDFKDFDKEFKDFDNDFKDFDKDFDNEEKREIQVLRLNDDEDIIPINNNNLNNNLNNRTVVQLKEMCKQNGIKPIPKTKAELINALTNRNN